MENKQAVELQRTSARIGLRVWGEWCRLADAGKVPEWQEDVERPTLRALLQLDDTELTGGRYRTHALAWCRFCRSWHQHGGLTGVDGRSFIGTEDELVELMRGGTDRYQPLVQCQTGIGLRLGHRGAHCFDQFVVGSDIITSSPYAQQGEGTGSGRGLGYHVLLVNTLHQSAIDAVVTAQPGLTPRLSGRWEPDMRFREWKLLRQWGKAGDALKELEEEKPRWKASSNDELVVNEAGDVVCDSCDKTFKTVRGLRVHQSSGVCGWRGRG